MDNGKGKEIQIAKVVNLLRKKLWIIIIFIGIGAGIGFAQAHFNQAEPIYESSASIVLRENSDYMTTLLVFITEPPVLETAVSELNVNISAEQLLQRINVQPVNQSQIVRISAYDSTPERAAEIANTVAFVYKDTVADVLKYNGVDIIAEAKVREGQQPINTNSNRRVFVTAIFGLLAGIGFVILLDSLDTKIRNERDIERSLEVPVLGSVSKVNQRFLIKNRKL